MMDNLAENREGRRVSTIWSRSQTVSPHSVWRKNLMASERDYTIEVNVMRVGVVRYTGTLLYRGCPLWRGVR